MKRITPIFFLALIWFSYCQSPSQESSDAEKENVYAAAKANYETLCSTCHGEQMQAFVDRQWKYGKDENALYKSISEGFPDAGMPAWSASLSDTAIHQLVAYIQTGIEQVERYGFEAVTLANDTLTSGDMTYVLDTVASGFNVPWSMEFLPDGDLLVTERGGTFYRVNQRGEKRIIKGAPTVRARGQGGLLDVLLHPDFSQNQQLYLSYSALKVVNGDSLTTTKVSRYNFNGDRLSNELSILDATPYTNRRHHFGGKLQFGSDGDLYITVGDRGERGVNPAD